MTQEALPSAGQYVRPAGKVNAPAIRMQYCKRSLMPKRSRLRSSWQAPGLAMPPQLTFQPHSSCIRSLWQSGNWMQRRTQASKVGSTD